MEMAQIDTTKATVGGGVTSSESLTERAFGHFMAAPAAILQSG